MTCARALLLPLAVCGCVLLALGLALVGVSDAAWEEP